MRNSGVRRPGVSMAICAAMAVGGGAAVAWGAWTMDALGRETGATATAIGIGLLPLILGPLFFFNFWWALRLVRRMRRGDKILARWRVAPATFELFRDAEARRPGQRNDWRPPRRTPRDGLEVIFSEDAVLIGDTFFGLASTGLARFDGVRMTESGTACLEFGTVLTWASSQPTFRIHRSRGALRVPIAHDAHVSAGRVLRHYADVIARRTIVKPHFWRSRIRLGLGATLVGGLAAAVGFGFRGSDWPPVEIQVALAVAGTIVALGGLVLAAAAAAFRTKQYRG